MQSTSSTADWPRSLTPEAREEIRRLHGTKPWRHAKILLLLAIWLGAAILAIEASSLWVRVPCWVLIGLSLHGLGVFMHEGAHHNLFRRPLADRFIGFFCGLPVLFSCSAYRATHMLHHRYENTADDPDNLEAAFPHPGLRRLVYGAFYLVGGLMYTVLLIVTGPFRAAGRREKLLCVVEPLAMAGLYSGLFLAARQDATIASWLVRGWLAGLPVAILIANVRGLAEHTLLEHESPPHPLRSTRSLPSHRLVSFFFNNQNYHLEHHLFPRVPWYNLPRLHDLLASEYRRAEAPADEGYLAFLGTAVRSAMPGAGARSSGR